MADDPIIISIIQAIDNKMILMRKKMTSNNIYKNGNGSGAKETNCKTIEGTNKETQYKGLYKDEKIGSHQEYNDKGKRVRFAETP